MRVMRKVLVWVILCLIVALSMAAASPAEGEKQTYTVSGCSAGGRTFSPDGWVASSVPAAAHAAIDDCATTGKMGFDFGAMSDAVGRWTFSAPRGTSLVSILIYDLVGSADPHHSLVFHAVGEDGTWDTAFPAAGLVSLASPAGFGFVTSRSLVIEARCAGVCASPGSLRASRIDVGLLDLSAPAVTFDPSRQAFRFADAGGGVASADLEIDGRSIIWRSAGAVPRAVHAGRALSDEW